MVLSIPMISAGWLILARISRLTQMRNTMFSSAGRHQRWRITIFSIFHSWANHVLVDGVSLGFFFYSDAEESGKNNQILDTHYQKYANDLFLFYVIGQACIVLRRYWFRQSSWYNYILHQANGTLFVAAGPMNCPACITAWPCGNTSPTTASRRLAWP